jgi:hypothetical protein
MARRRRAVASASASSPREAPILGQGGSAPSTIKGKERAFQVFIVEFFPIQFPGVVVDFSRGLNNLTPDGQQIVCQLLVLQAFAGFLAFIARLSSNGDLLSNGTALQYLSYVFNALSKNFPNRDNAVMNGHSDWYTKLRKDMTKKITARCILMVCIFVT